MESFTQLSLRWQWKWQKKGLGIHQNSLSRAVKSLPLMEPRGKGKPQRSKSREAKGPEAQREEALTVRIQGWEPNRQGRKEGRDTEVDGRGPGRDARRGQATGTLTETGRESSNPTKISPPPPRRPGQCPHFREARLLTANGTSRSWQRRMRQTGDAQNVIVTCTELAACAESRRSLRLRDREGLTLWPGPYFPGTWLASDPGNLPWAAEGYDMNVLRLTFATIFLVFTRNTGLEIMTPVFLSP